MCSCSLKTSPNQKHVNIEGSYTHNRKIMGYYAKDVAPLCSCSSCIALVVLKMLWLQNEGTHTLKKKYNLNALHCKSLCMKAYAK